MVAADDRCSEAHAAIPTGYNPGAPETIQGVAAGVKVLRLWGY